MRCHFVHRKLWIMVKRQYHIILFIFGFLYYLIVPPLVVSSRSWEDYPGMHNLYMYYKDGYMSDYFLYIIFVGFFFLSGSFASSLSHNPYKIVKSNRVVRSKSLFIISMPLFLYCQLLILQNRGSLFQGYLVEVDAPFVGTIASASMFYLFMFIYNKSGIYSKGISKMLIVILLELSIVLMGLGSRMYVFIIFISILVYYLDMNIISLRKLLLYGGLGALFVLAIGIWRQGGTNITMEGLVYIGVAEPTYTWISAISMYDMNTLPLFAFPYNFISSFLNFIPHVLLPNKSELISDVALQYDAPLGALNIIVSLISNFGILGSLVAIFLLGYLLTYIRLHWQTIFGQTYYYCVCGVIPFQLFRDPFTVVNKAFFSNLLLVPLLFILLSRILKGLLNTKPVGDFNKENI